MLAMNFFTQFLFIDGEDSALVLGHSSLLSDKAILRHIEVGSVVVEPFKRSNLSTSRYQRYVLSFLMID